MHTGTIKLCDLFCISQFHWSIFLALPFLHHFTPSLLWIFSTNWPLWLHKNSYKLLKIIKKSMSILHYITTKILSWSTQANNSVAISYFRFFLHSWYFSLLTHCEPGLSVPLIMQTLHLSMYYLKGFNVLLVVHIHSLKTLF